VWSLHPSGHAPKCGPVVRLSFSQVATSLAISPASHKHCFKLAVFDSTVYKSWPEVAQDRIRWTQLLQCVDLPQAQSASRPPLGLQGCAVCPMLECADLSTSSGHAGCYRGDVVSFPFLSSSSFALTGQGNRNCNCINTGKGNCINCIHRNKAQMPQFI
jgi:hypothetical protein